LFEMLYHCHCRSVDNAASCHPIPCHVTLGFSHTPHFIHHTSDRSELETHDDGATPSSSSEDLDVVLAVARDSNKATHELQPDDFEVMNT
jgi:hypothetical protein